MTTGDHSFDGLENTATAALQCLWQEFRLPAELSAFRTLQYQAALMTFGTPPPAGDPGMDSEDRRWPISFRKAAGLKSCFRSSPRSSAGFIAEFQIS